MRLQARILPPLLLVLSVAALVASSAASATQAARATAASSPLTGKCHDLDGLATTVEADILAQKASGLTAEMDVIKAFAAATPSSIRPDFQTLAAVFGKVMDVLKGGLSATSLLKLEALAPSLKTAKVTAAEAAVQKWAKKGCPGA